MERLCHETSRADDIYLLSIDFTCCDMTKICYTSHVVTTFSFGFQVFYSIETDSYI